MFWGGSLLGRGSRWVFFATSVLLLLPVDTVAEGREQPLERWSCAGDEPRWHFLREAVRYVIWDGQAPLRTSLKRFTGLLPIWIKEQTGLDNEEQIATGAPCPTGEIFLMLMDYVFSNVERIRKDNSIDMNSFITILHALQVRLPSYTAVLTSSWPIFGVLMLAQRDLLRLGLGPPGPSEESSSDADGSDGSTEGEGRNLDGSRGAGTRRPDLSPFAMALIPFSRICEAGQPLARALEAWLQIPTLDGGPPLPPLPLETRLAAWRLQQKLAAEPSLCAGDHAASAAARLVASGILPQVPWGGMSGNSYNSTGWKPAFLMLKTLLDRSLHSAGGWSRLIFSGWPLMAVLHRLQEAYTREAICGEVEQNAYGLLSRASPESVWLCVRRGQGVVEERWRQQGEFPDCIKIAEAMRGPQYKNCLFADVGANLGSCSLMLARQGLEVLAVEPNPMTADLFRAAVLRNGLQDKITVVQAAVGRHSSSQAALHCPGGHSAICHVLPVSSQPPAADAPAGGGQEELVQVISLDDLLAAHGSKRPLCGVKIDVEGAEYEVLLGGQETLKKTKPILFLELHPHELRERGTSSEHVINKLTNELGYTEFIPLSEGTAPSCSGTRSNSASSPAASAGSRSDEGDGSGGLGGNGTHSGRCWGSAAQLMVPGFEGVADACACSNACYDRLRPKRNDDGSEALGCRCWDFEVASGRCNLYHTCGTSGRGQVDPNPGQGNEPPACPGWWSGEMNGILRISAEQ
ncbi:unnamed protein product [Polarella glacialis]|uniref:Methyltransferase FkbM domain-containing protein n=1 Tax=Polarella glacialis TaxID=89957 RepID=A0A813HA85_POLGL|nr:unnamed protein product [Polarella glacialis]